MSQELVSVIMPTYNAGQYLADSIRCILRQTYENLELVITDDASTDGDTVKILKEFELSDKRVNVEYLNENHGAGFARNRGIERAKGRYIAFCDSDDRWITEKLKIQINYMKEKKCSLTCSSYVICDQRYEAMGINIPPSRITFNMLKRDNKIGCLTAIYDVHKLGKKYFMPTLRKRQDWAMFLEILRQCKVCYAYTSQPLAHYCMRNDSVSSNKWELIKYNIAVYHNILHFNYLKAYLYFFFLFLPTYGLKIAKRKINSMQYIRKMSVCI